MLLNVVIVFSMLLLVVVCFVGFCGAVCSYFVLLFCRVVCIVGLCGFVCSYSALLASFISLMFALYGPATWYANWFCLLREGSMVVCVLMWRSLL